MQTSETFTSEEGYKISCILVRTQDGLVMSRYQVQSPENKGREAKGERTIGGDCLYETMDKALEGAKFEYEQYKKHQEFLAEIEAKELAEQAVQKAKVEANRGKKIAERARDARLDKPSKLPIQFGLGTGSMREVMDRAVAQGRYIVEVQVDDYAAKKRDKQVIERVRASGYILGLSNPNIPLVKDGLAAQQRLKENNYTKSEYRVYSGNKKVDPFREISKTEYDYAKEKEHGHQ